MTTVYSRTYADFAYNEYYQTNIAVTAVPAAYSLTYSIDVATGYPSLYVVDPDVFTSWSTTSDPYIKNYRYGAILPPPGARDVASLVFTSATTYPVFIFCGPYITTVSSTARTLSQNCSGVTVSAQWVDLNIAAITSASRSSLQTGLPTPTGTENNNNGNNSDSGLPLGTVIAIAVAAFVLAGLIAAGVILFLVRKKKAADKSIPPPPPPGFNPYPPNFNPAYSSQPLLQPPQALYFPPPPSSADSNTVPYQPYPGVSYPMSPNPVPAPYPMNANYSAAPLNVSATTGGGTLNSSGNNSNNLFIPPPGSNPESGDSRQSGQGVVMLKQ
ncbi:hypothetical protein BJ742DRAFT_824433 [Cladochytrium replicatum]|nr:hypothetical protein BJ742DRAFT_824433 [Cladochytrium replicatum]